MHQPPPPTSGGEPTIAEVATAYLDDRAAALGIAQARAHCRPVVASLGWLRVADLRQAHVRGYVKVRADKGLAGGTIREELNKLRAALRWGAAEGVCPRVDFRIPVSGEPRRRWLTREEAAALLAAAASPHVRLAILIMLHTAARPSAAVELTWDRCDFARGVVDLGHKEGGKTRAIVPMTPTLRAALLAAADGRSGDRVVEYRGRPVARVTTGWANAMRRAGIAHCTRHDLRRTAATYMLLGGVPIEKVARYLGHASIAVTAKVYARHTTAWLVEAAAAIEG